MTDITPATGNLLGNGVKDITGTTWLLGHDLKSPTAIIISTLEMVIALHEDDEDMAHTVHLLKGALVADPNNFFLTPFASCEGCAPGRPAPARE